MHWPWSLGVARATVLGFWGEFDTVLGALGGLEVVFFTVGRPGRPFLKSLRMVLRTVLGLRGGHDDSFVAFG